MVWKTSVERASRWREILRRQAGSGLSIRAFCTREGISEPSFFAWRRRLREADGEGAGRDGGSSGHEVVDGAGLFVPLQVVDSAPALEILHPLGYRVRVHGVVDRDALREIIEVLDERPQR